MLIGGQPKLVIKVGKSTVWRIPALLGSSVHGIIGEVGTVDVDAETGEILANEGLKEQLLKHVEAIASPSPVAA